MNKKCCGTCRHHLPLPLDEWICDNEESENYSLETGYEDSCADYESRRDNDE